MKDNLVFSSNSIPNFSSEKKFSLKKEIGYWVLLYSTIFALVALVISFVLFFMSPVMNDVQLEPTDLSEQMLSSFETENTKEAYQALVQKYCKIYAVPEQYVNRMIDIESGWNCEKINYNSDGSRDIGLMQLNESYIDYYAQRYFIGYGNIDIMNPEHSIQVGISYLNHLYKQFGSWNKVFAAYNCGPENVKKNQIPWSTQIYVQKIME